jgi:hypothetical protein
MDVNLASDILGSVKTEGIWVQGAEENIRQKKVEMVGGWRILP